MANTVKTALLLGALSALFLLLGEALGGAQGLVLGFLFAVVTNFASYWFSDKIVLRDVQRAGGRSRPPAVSTSSTRLAQRAGLPMPRVLRHPASRRRTRLRPAAIRSTPPSRRPRASCRC